MSSFENFVQCRIQTPLTASATDLALYAAEAPYNLPPVEGGLLVLCDSPGNPSKLEVIRYSHRTDLGLYGLERGQEGTTALEWTGPAYCYQGLMADDFQALLDSKVDKATGQSLMTDAERTKLTGIQAGAQVNTVTSVAGRTGAVTLAKGDVGLGNVDNTSDANKPVSTAQQTALNLKVDKVAGKGLSTNDLTAALLNKLNAAAPLDSPQLTGNATAPTADATDNDTTIANTAFVRAAMALFGVATNDAPLLADFNNVSLPTGLYRAYGDGTSTPTPNAPPGSGNNVLSVWVGRSSTSGTQYIVKANGSTAAAQRMWIGNAFTTTSLQWAELWHTGNLVKQTSPTDTTPGALMAVGAFGLGGRANNDSYIAGYPQTMAENISQIYRRTVGDMGVPGYSAGIHFGASDTWGRLRVAYSDARAWVQGGIASGGTGWTVELFHTGNVLGTVSQSGGAPTGAIIERGSNANGEYIKWADGTMICLLNTVVTDQALDVAYGSFFTGTRIWTFPASFISPPVVPPPAFNWGTSASWGHSRAATTSTNVVLRGLDIVTRAVGTSTYIQAIAIGRWF